MKQCLMISCFLFLTLNLNAQTAMRLQDCEEQFLTKNLYLLAQEYNITISEAQVIQARLWENPYFSTELNVINPDANKYFDIGKNGQKTFAIEQLIYLGGKKKNEVELAKLSVQVAQAEFQDLLRQLKYQLRISYFIIYHDNITISTFDKQLSGLDSLVTAYAVQAQKNNVSYKDVVRLQSLYLNLKNSKSDLLNEIYEEEKKIAILLSENIKIIPTPTEEEINKYHKELSKNIQELISIANENRIETQLSELSVQASVLNLKLQKSLAVPNLTMGANYDQNGGAFHNQVNLTLGMPLPILNRNQGNIKIADAEIKQASTQKELQTLYISQEVLEAYNKHIDAYENYQFVSKSHNKNFNTLYNGVALNFQRRNISMIEFTDFIESYSETIIQHNRIHKMLINTCEEINYTTNSNIF